MKEANGRQYQQSDKADGGDVLFGMKAICRVLGVSEATVIRYMREYDDFPVKKKAGGGYVSVSGELSKWFRDYVRRR